MAVQVNGRRGLGPPSGPTNLGADRPCVSREGGLPSHGPPAPRLLRPLDVGLRSTCWSLCSPPHARHVVGDNLAVVRYGAGTARLRRPELQAHLEGALGRALAAGWCLQWCAVRRRLNRAADALALEGRLWAQNLLRTSTRGIQYRTEWSFGNVPPHPPQPPR